MDKKVFRNKYNFLHFAKHKVLRRFTSKFSGAYFRVQFCIIKKLKIIFLQFCKMVSSKMYKTKIFLEPNINSTFAYILLLLSIYHPKGNYPRTTASDSKHLPALILNVFLVNILGLC